MLFTRAFHKGDDVGFAIAVECRVERIVKAQKPEKIGDLKADVRVVDEMICFSGL